MANCKPCVVLLLLFFLEHMAWADAKSRIAVEAVEYVIRKFGREAGKEGMEKLGSQLAQATSKYGEKKAVAAFRNVGPRLFRVVAESGQEAPVALRILGRYGEEGLHLVTNSRRLSLCASYGDDAAVAMLKHKGIAEPLIHHFGTPCARALQPLNGQNARRLAHLMDEGLLSQLPKQQELWRVIAQYGNRAMEWIWRNKGSLLVGGLVVAFVRDPEPFLHAMEHGIDVTLKPIAQKAAPWIGTTIGIAMSVLLALFCLRRLWRKGKKA
jgi:hypothetical protein